MDDLSSLLGAHDKSQDLIDKLVNLLDRQTDHKLNPNVMLGFLGLFNLLSIMTVVQGNPGGGFKEISGQADKSDAGISGQNITDTLSSLLNPTSGGQPDLMGLLGSLASKKNINPNLLLSLFSMLNNQGANLPENSQPKDVTPVNKVETSAENTEKKTSDDKKEVELKYDRKRGST